MTSEENYDYNLQDEDPNTIFDWNELIPTLVVYGVTFKLGIIGNCLIIFTTLRYRRMQSVTNVLLSSLAFSDLIVIIVCIPVKVAKLFSYTWMMGLFVCKVVHYMQNVSAISSVLTLMTISLERYYAIVHPMKAKYICTISQTKRIIALVWILSFLLAIPTLIAQIQLPVGQNNQFYWCVRDWNNIIIWRFHEIYMLIVILVGPFCVMTFSYTLICHEVWKVIKQRSVMTSEKALTRNHHSIKEQNNDNNEKDFEAIQLNNNKKKSIGKNGRDDIQMVKQVICMLVAVVVFFAVCWAPVLIDSVLTAFNVLPNIRIGWPKYMSTAFHLMAYLNSGINPIIYGFMSKNFRDTFKMKLCCSRRIKYRYRGSSNYSLQISRQISRTGSQTKNTTIR